LERDEYAKIQRVFLSAQTGEGLDMLRQAIAEFAKAGYAASLDGAEPAEPRNVDESN
jgi:GTP-binding protein HflX